MPTSCVTESYRKTSGGFVQPGYSYSIATELTALRFLLYFYVPPLLFFRADFYVNAALCYNLKNQSESLCMRIQQNNITHLLFIRKSYNSESFLLNHLFSHILTNAVILVC